MKLKNKSINIFNNKTIIWRKKSEINKCLKIKIISKNKEIKLFYKNFIVDKWCNNINLKNNKIMYLSTDKENKINLFLKSWNLYFYKKIKFKGKGFRIKFFKKIKLIKFYFGKSHKTFIFVSRIKRKKINKYKFMLSSINNTKLKKLSKSIINIKKINPYTLRGIREMWKKLM